MFRQRPLKKTHNDSRMTLDAKHKDILKKFGRNNKELTKHKNMLCLIDEKLNNIYNKEIDKRTIVDYNTLQVLNLKKKNINEKIESIVNEDNKKNYELETISLRLEYYKKCQDETLVNKRKYNQNKRKSKFDAHENKNSLMKFFNNKKQHNSNEKTKSSSSSSSYTTERTRADLLNDYLRKVDDEYLPMKRCMKIDHIIYKCPKCKINCQIDKIKACTVCLKCGMVSEYIDHELNPPSFKELEQKNVPQSSGYQRINHFCEWLNQFQAKENTDIPDEIFNQISVELKKQRRLELHKLRPEQTKIMLKKLNLSDYYEHVPFILCTMTGQSPPSLDPDTEDKLKTMFKEVQPAFLKHCPKTRKNFLSYCYIIHKFLELLDIDEYLSYFPLLKSNEKLRDQEQVWKLICQELKWKYYPSF